MAKIEKIEAGDCQVCSRRFAVDGQGLMVNHGFQRPGWGYLVGGCFGVGHVPYQHGKARLEEWRERIVRQLANMEAHLRNLQSGKITSLTDVVAPAPKPTEENPEPTRPVIEPPHPHWERSLAYAIHKEESDIEAAKQHIAYLDARIEVWVYVEVLPQKFSGRMVDQFEIGDEVWYGDTKVTVRKTHLSMFGMRRSSHDGVLIEWTTDEGKVRQHKARARNLSFERPEEIAARKPPSEKPEKPKLHNPTPEKILRQMVEEEFPAPVGHPERGSYWLSRAELSFGVYLDLGREGWFDSYHLKVSARFGATVKDGEEKVIWRNKECFDAAQALREAFPAIRKHANLPPTS